MTIFNVFLGLDIKGCLENQRSRIWSVKKLAKRDREQAKASQIREFMEKWQVDYLGEVKANWKWVKSECWRWFARAKMTNEQLFT